MSDLAARLRAREPLLGTLLRMPNEALIEMTALVGMDFVVIDTEHGPADQVSLGHHLTAAAAAGIPALVRIGNLSEILRVLDLGAAGIIAPHVSSVEQAETVVKAASYPPRGDRGFATYTRSGRYGLIGVAEHLENSATGVIVILMVEDGAGVAAAEQMSAIDGVDGLFVGPADLSVALGHPGAMEGHEVRSAISQVHQAAKRAGVAVVSITADPAIAREHFAAGSTMVIYNVLASLGGMFTRLAGAHPGAGSTSADQGNAGTAPTVLLPGMLGTTRLWDSVVPQLDPRLAARGERIDLDDSVSGMAESVLAQAPERFNLVGHSLGGIVALEIVRLAPQRVSRLVLVNCSGRGPSDEQLESWSNLADRTRAGDFGELVDEQAEINLGPAAHRSELGTAWREAAHQVGAQGFLRQLAAQKSRPDSLSSLGAITIPTLVVSGELDLVSPPDVQVELAEGIPGAEHVIVPGAGHMVPMDSATELAAVLSDFLAG
ncbi:MAG: aldolase/citrate lyase family protein [Actinomycetota bacterium]|nr:aldolase/citrate lyase family protein [Actinomycetota bacterium]